MTASLRTLVSLLRSLLVLGLFESTDVPSVLFPIGISMALSLAPLLEDTFFYVIWNEKLSSMPGNIDALNMTFS